MAFRVLFVCAANICRSPSAARVLTEQLPDDLRSEVSTESAGVAAAQGKPWCELAQVWLIQHEVLQPDVSERRRSRQLTASRLTRAELVLAADAEVRSAVVRTSPRVRGRLFTFAEAGTLALGVQHALEEDQSDSVVRLEPLPGARGAARLEWLVNEMDAARGLVVPKRGDPTLADPQDPHRSGRASSHAAAMRDLSDAVTTLAYTMAKINGA